MERQPVYHGIINNNNVRVKREMRRKLRAMIYNEISKEGHLSKKTKGYIAFIRYIEGENTSTKIHTYIMKIKGKFETKL